MPDEEAGALARSLEVKRDRLADGLRELGFAHAAHAPAPTS